MDEKDEKLDLTTLTAGRDPARFEPMVRSVAARGVAALALQNTLPAQLWRWSRPVLAVSALVVLGGLFGLSRPEPQKSQSLEQSVLRWSAQGYVPTAAELFKTLGGSDGR